METNKQVRFSGADWYGPTRQLTVTVGGAGGIGSWLILFLAKMGIKINVYEKDNVDETNIGGQAYGEEHIGRAKVHAIKDVVKTAGSQEYANNIRYLGEYIAGSPVNCIVFSSFDNMEARRKMLNQWEHHAKNFPSGKCVFIDGRMTMEYFEVFVVTLGNINVYKKNYMFSSEEATKLPCSAKATSHFGAATAWQMVLNFTNFMGSKHRDYPFMVECFGPLNHIKNKYIKK